VHLQRVPLVVQHAPLSGAKPADRESCAALSQEKRRASALGGTSSLMRNAGAGTRAYTPWLSLGVIRKPVSCVLPARSVNTALPLSVRSRAAARIANRTRNAIEYCQK